jgi:hypothetical protein
MSVLNIFEIKNSEMKRNKSSHSVRHICIVTIKRKTIQPYNYKFTKFYETESIENIDFINTLKFIFEQNELPILSVYQSENNWWLLTTHQVIGNINNKNIVIPLNEIEKIDWDDFKGIRKKEITEISIHLVNDKTEKLFIETGKASMIPIYSFMNVGTE